MVLSISPIKNRAGICNIVPDELPMPMWRHEICVFDRANANPAFQFVLFRYTP